MPNGDDGVFPQLYPDNSHAKELVNFMVGFGYAPKLLVDGKLVETSSENLISESRQLDVFGSSN